MRAFHLRNPVELATDRRTRRDVAEVFLDLLFGLRGCDVAGDHEHCVRGTVVSAKPFLYVFDRRCVQVFHRSDGFPGIRVTRRIGAERDDLGGLAIGLVLPLALLVLHDAALLIEHFLVDGTEQVTHAIRFHPQRHVERRSGYVLEVVRAVEPGGAVQLGGAGCLHDLEPVVLVILGSVEHQVFEQVRKPGATGTLVLAADVVPDVHRDDWRLVILVHDECESVREHELLVRDVHRRQRCRLRSAQTRRR